MISYCHPLTRPGYPLREHPWAPWQLVVLDGKALSIRICPVCGEQERKPEEPKR